MTSRAATLFLALCTAFSMAAVEDGEIQRRQIEAAAERHTQQTAYISPQPKQVSEADPDAPPYLGDFRITVYTPECDGGVWGYQTATGATSQHLATCAVDPDVIPLGTVIDLGGVLSLVAADTGSAVRGNVIDIFFDGTKEQALEWVSGFGDTAPVWVQVMPQG